MWRFLEDGQSLGEDSTGFRDATVQPGVTYNYRARAAGFMGPSGPSNTVVASVPPPSPPPAAPSNLTAAMSGVNVVLIWQDNSTNESQFYIERCQGAGCASFIGLGASPPNVPTWTDYNAAAGQSYSYRVRAWNLAGGFSAVLQHRHDRHSRGNAGAAECSQQPRRPSAECEPDPADLGEQQPPTRTG